MASERKPLKTYNRIPETFEELVSNYTTKFISKQVFFVYLFLEFNNHKNSSNNYTFNCLFFYFTEKRNIFQ